jgi:hypothetical protein
MFHALGFSASKFKEFALDKNPVLSKGSKNYYVG